MTDGWRSAGFFLARTPLLPLKVFWRLASGELSGQDLLEDAAVAEALALASPGFTAELRRGLESGSLSSGLRRTLVRYMVRMSTRATPLGLMAGCSWGLVEGEVSRIELPPRSAYRRLTRLDVRFQAQIADEVVARADEATLAELCFRTHPDVRVDHGSVRLARLRQSPAGDVPELVEVAADEPLVLLLDEAREGALGMCLVAALLDAGLADEVDEASDFVRAVAGAGLLLSGFHAPMTGDQMHQAFEAWPSSTRERISRPRRRAISLVRGMDDRPLATLVAPAGEVDCWAADPEADFGPGPVVDLWKPAVSARLRPKDVGELIPALDLLSRLSLWSPHPALEAFTGDFLDRYDEQWELDTLSLHQRAGVPLLMALDPESGIKFGGGVSEDIAPLIDRLQFPSVDALAPRHQAEGYLLDAVVRHAARDGASWELDDADIAALATADPGEFPDSVAVGATRCRIDGAPTWVLRSVSGPAAMSRIARFARADPGLLAAVRRFCAEEQAGRTDVTIVDFIHQPPGRAANLAAHPWLRRSECDLFGIGARDGEVVELADLRLTMRAGVFVLFSAATGREVLPRLPSSYNYEISPFPLVRFLGALQHGRARRDLGWDWGALDHSPKLPRVTHAGVVLAPARWRLSRRDLSGLLAAQEPTDLKRAGAELRDRWGLPRLIGITQDDLVLPVDLDSPILLDQLVAAARRDHDLLLTELFVSEAGDLVADGPEGSYAHEVVLPFSRPHTDSARVSQVDNVTAQRAGRRTGPPCSDPAIVHPPGSEWLYAEVYCGSADADAVLAALHDHVDSWHVQRWFFIRYETSAWHLRLRLQGVPAHLLSTVVPTLRHLFDQSDLAGLISRWTLDTYRPEVQRYGGPSGLEVCHDIFHADSDAFVRLVAHGHVDDPGLRWQLALRAGHDLLISLGLDLRSRLRLIETARDRFQWEHLADRRFMKAVASQYREDRARVEEVLTADWSPIPEVAEVLAWRAERIVESAERLEELWRTGQLNRPVAGLAPSLLHMTFNRFLRSQQRAQETVLYDYLARALRSQLARD